jgi:hypothetical protein
MAHRIKPKDFHLYFSVREARVYCSDHRCPCPGDVLSLPWPTAFTWTKLSKVVRRHIEDNISETPNRSETSDHSAAIELCNLLIRSLSDLEGLLGAGLVPIDDALEQVQETARTIAEELGA